MTVSNTPGAPCWIELYTPDPDAAAAFYGGLFGWTTEGPQAEFGGYALWLREGEPVAGCMRNDGSGQNAWSVYLESRDVDRTTEKVRAAGGQVVYEPMDVGPMGRAAFYVDPAGAAIGAWQPDQHEGFAVRGQVGAPAWFEALSTDYEQSLAFYRDAFDWDVQTMADTEDFRYSTLGAGQAALAGIMDARNFLGDAGSRWQFYVEVPDTDDLVARATSAGAQLTMPVDDSPYGRLAALEDPAGVPFTVLGPNRARTSD